MSDPISFTPIGTYHAKGAFKSSTPVQSGMDETRVGEIHFAEGIYFHSAFDGYQSGDRIWLIYHFHEAKGWKEKVMPPRFSKKKVGVFATRSPHRPNPIGMSSLILGECSPRHVVVEGGDLIDGTPILDIKPYLSFADAYADESPGWYQPVDPYLITFGQLAVDQLEFIEDRDVRMASAVMRNIEYPPLLDSRKRIRKEGEAYVFAYRTWRVDFHFEDSRKILITGIRSGYTEADMDDPIDPHEDKEIHRAFRDRFC